MRRQRDAKADARLCSHDHLIHWLNHVMPPPHIAIVEPRLTPCRVIRTARDTFSPPCPSLNVSRCLLRTATCSTGNMEGASCDLPRAPWSWPA